MPMAGTAAATGMGAMTAARQGEGRRSIAAAGRGMPAAATARSGGAAARALGRRRGGKRRGLGLGPAAATGWTGTGIRAAAASTGGTARCSNLGLIRLLPRLATRAVGHDDFDRGADHARNRVSQVASADLPGLIELIMYRWYAELRVARLGGNLVTSVTTVTPGLGHLASRAARGHFLVWSPLVAGHAMRLV
jgi:hypothetical protein